MLLENFLISDVIFACQPIFSTLYIRKFDAFSASTLLVGQQEGHQTKGH